VPSILYGELPMARTIPSASRRQLLKNTTILIGGFAVSSYFPTSTLAASGNRQDAKIQRGVVLVLASNPEPATITSYISTSGPIHPIATKIHEGLLEYDFDLKPIPSLAESWSLSPDSKSVTFHLRKNVYWHDGEPFTSADVKF